MRHLTLCTLICSFLFFDLAHSQNILKIVKIYALIDLNESSGLKIDDNVKVFRRLESGETIKIGEMKIVKFAQGKCAGKIIAQEPGYTIRVGDFVQMQRLKEKITPIDKTPQVTSSGSAGGGTEKGDREVSFLGFYMKRIGTTNFTFETGSIKLSYGYFISDRIQLGISPQFMITSGDGGGTTIIFSASVFINYNLVVSSKMIPYLSGQWYQDDFSPEYGDLLDYSFITFGAGLRNFLTEYAALNTSLSYGFSLRSNGGSGIITVMSGLSFIF